MTSALALLAGKLSASAIRVMGLGLASNLPGKVSRRICRDVLADLASQTSRGIVAVTGTNGKSTTAGLVAAIMSRARLKVVHNRQGANLVTGLTATLVDASGWNGVIDADYCLFEIDEAALPVVAKEVGISTVLVTNLFRDQLDRFGELDTTARLISRGIVQQKSLAVLNADDPNVAQMVPDCRRIFYGLESMESKDATPGEATSDESIPASGTGELSYCAACGVEYSFSRRFYGQLGHYRCCACGVTRPQPEVEARAIKLAPFGSSFQLKYGPGLFSVELPLPGIFNVYNAVAAAALCFALEIEAKHVREGLTGYATLFGRSEKIQVEGKAVLIQLIKNPAGASQAVLAAAQDPGARILIAINDNYADGRDVSWLWDAEFEHLCAAGGPFVVAGRRAHDMAVRLKYAGIDPRSIVVEPDLNAALSRGLAATGAGQTLWLLPTYTCLLELQKIFKARGLSLAGT